MAQISTDAAYDTKVRAKSIPTHPGSRRAPGGPSCDQLLRKGKLADRIAAMGERLMTTVVLAITLVAMVAVVAVFALLAGYILPGRAPDHDLWSGAVGGFAQALATLAGGAFVLLAALGAVHAARIQATGTVEAARIAAKEAQQARDGDRLIRARTLAVDARHQMAATNSWLIIVRIFADPEGIYLSKETPINLGPPTKAEMTLPAMGKWPLHYRAVMGAEIASLISHYAYECRRIREITLEIAKSTEPTLEREMRMGMLERALDRERLNEGHLTKALEFVEECTDVADLDAYLAPGLEHPEVP